MRHGSMGYSRLEHWRIGGRVYDLVGLLRCFKTMVVLLQDLVAHYVAAPKQVWYPES